MKNKFSPHKQYLFGLLFFRNAKKIHVDQSILQTFHSVLKEASLKPLKEAAVKEVFPKCVYH